MSLLHFLILSLATWRVSSLIVNESGPLGIFERFRHLVGIRANERSESYATNGLAELFTCLWCCSVWCGLGWTLFYWLAPEAAIWAALSFALSAIAVMIDGYTTS